MSVEQLEELFLATGWGPLLVKLAREDAEREGRTECLLALLRVRFGEDPVLEEVASGLRSGSTAWRPSWRSSRPQVRSR